MTDLTRSTERRAFTALAKDVAEIRANYRQLPPRVMAVNTFEILWDQFVARLRPLVRQLDGQPWNPVDPRIANEVEAIDDLRLDLEGRQSTAIPKYHDPLATILRASLRAPTLTLYEVFGPLESHGVVQRPILNYQRFNAQVAEAKADIVRYRRELEDEIQREGIRLRELQDAGASLILATIRSLLWKNATRRTVTVIGALVVGWLTPPVRAAVAAVVMWLRSL
jgi:hypothetical protein